MCSGTHSVLVRPKPATFSCSPVAIGLVPMGGHRGDAADRFGQPGHHQVAARVGDELGDVRDAAGRTRQVGAADGRGCLPLGSALVDPPEVLAGIGGEAPGGGEDPLPLDQRAGAAALSAVALDVELRGERVGPARGGGSARRLRTPARSS